MKGQWKHVSRAVPCPICERFDWCTISDDGKLAKCMRVESKREIKQTDGQPAWLHPIGDSDEYRKLPSSAPMQRLKIGEVQSLYNQFAKKLTMGKLSSASKSLGVSGDSLKAFRIGFCDNPPSFSFPMFDGNGIACGIRLRKECGKKLCIPGSRNGLFISSDAIHGAILLPEGPTDAAAARDYGYFAIGRPSNSGGGEQLVALLKSSQPQDVIIVADNDSAKWRPDGKPFWPGIEGALRICEQILPYCRSLKFIMPPDGAKDIRAWKGSREKLRTAIDSSPVVSGKWISRAWKRIEIKRCDESRGAA